MLPRGHALGALGINLVGLYGLRGGSIGEPFNLSSTLYVIEPPLPHHTFSFSSAYTTRPHKRINHGA